MSAGECRAACSFAINVSNGKLACIDGILIASHHFRTSRLCVRGIRKLFFSADKLRLRFLAPAIVKSTAAAQWIETIGDMAGEHTNPRSEWKSIRNGNAWWLMLSKQRFVFFSLCLLHRTWIHSIVKEKREEIELKTDFSALKDCKLCSAFWWKLRACTGFHFENGNWAQRIDEVRSLLS